MPPRPTAVGPGTRPPEFTEVAREVRHLPLVERIDAISRQMLGLPYLDDPIGEGDGIDGDPIARYDGFDCLTYVEEVLALSLAGEPDHAAWIRNDLRYGGQAPSYRTRQHFMELQWIPAALSRGWLVDTTATYGEVLNLRKEVDDALWSRWPARAQFDLADEDLPRGTMSLNVLPLAAAIEAAPRIRPGSIVMTVREDRSYKPLWITHLGFVVPGPSPTFRHASSMKSVRAVTDHDLTRYLRHLTTYENWKTVGIAIFEPVEQGPRRAGPR